MFSARTGFSPVMRVPCSTPGKIEIICPGPTATVLPLIMNSSVPLSTIVSCSRRWTCGLKSEPGL